MSIFGWDYPPGCSSTPYDAPDPPEDCPICHAPNCDDDGEPVCADAADFCSVTCRDAYTAKQRIDDEAEAAYYAAQEKLEAEWEKTWASQELEP